MKSNGYGRAKQRIIVQVDQCHKDEVAGKLGVLPFKEDGEPSQAYFAWTRLTCRPGNDEDVIFDLFRIIGAPGEGLDWHVVWEDSEY